MVVLVLGTSGAGALVPFDTYARITVDQERYDHLDVVSGEEVVEITIQNIHDTETIRVSSQEVSVLTEDRKTFWTPEADTPAFEDLEPGETMTATWDGWGKTVIPPTDATPTLQVPYVDGTMPAWPDTYWAHWSYLEPDGDRNTQLATTFELEDRIPELEETIPELEDPTSR